jgi:pyrroloquinoline-quinone synthase
MNANVLDAIVARHDLNEHPFYRAWRAGTLPRAKLAAYACEYAPFIRTIELGWRSLGYADYAAAEQDHARLWDEFREALGPAGEPSCPEAKKLVDEMHGSFADPVEALGALYAFEAQQPSTARSKLDGLRAHATRYAVPEDKAAYFRIHAEDYGERELLRGLFLARLTPTEHARAARACERACKAMWSALDGIMGGSSAAINPTDRHASAVSQ